MKEYDVIIGLEIHAELATESKMFCACDNDAHGKEPNTTVCPICLGHPGTLPVPNRQAIEWTVLIGLALNCRIASTSKFDRKNYFYPDLPKGYQISQYDLPFCRDGWLESGGHRIAITRLHLEEDTGKLAHPAGKAYSLVDFNRAGTPLVEMVTEPVIPDAATAKAFGQRYQQILRYLKVSNADMEKGEMRCEANVSLQEKGTWEYRPGDGIVAKNGQTLNPKIELKNINSFRALEKAIEYEIARQKKCLEDGEKLVQETRGWNQDKGATVSQRIKETSADYRYFPEPDIPPIEIRAEWLDSIKARLIEMPGEKAARFINEYDLSEQDAETLVGDKALADYAEAVISELRAWIIAEGDEWERQKKRLAKVVSNWLLSELLKHLNAVGETVGDLKISAENFAELVKLVHLDRINSSAAQKILEEMYASGGDPTDIMSRLGLEQMDDDAELEKIVADVILKNEKQADEYRAGKEAVLQYLVGQTMAATRGKANPKKVQEIFKKLLVISNKS